jgi:hypothetical protein
LPSRMFADLRFAATFAYLASLAEITLGIPQSSMTNRKRPAYLPHFAIPVDFAR